VARTEYLLGPNSEKEMDEYIKDIPILEDTMKGFVKDGNLKPTRAEFFKIAQANGLKMDKTEAVQYMNDCHNVILYSSMGAYHLDMSKVANLRIGVEGDEASLEAGEKEDADS
jgi:hypothetical protein